MQPNTVALVDISAIAHAIWHTSDTLSNRDQVSANIVARVRSVSSGFPFVAVCCDSRSFRYEIDPNYKAQRPERDAGLHFQLDKAIARLREDGFVVWKEDGFEADDIIATATELAVQQGYGVVIVSSDKDLLQLVRSTVVAKSLQDGSIRDVDAVMTKFGVRPDQMRDYLTLVGDKSDNVPGAEGIGPARAAKLLATFDTLDTLYATLETTEASDLGITPSIAKSLEAFKVQMPTTRSLIALRTDVPISLDILLAGRTESAGTPTTSLEIEDMPDMLPIGDIMEPSTTAPVAPSQPPVNATAPVVPSVTAATPEPSATPISRPEPPQAVPAPSVALAKADDVLVVDAEVVYERQLDPRNLKELERMATILDKSGMFLQSYGNAPAVLAAVVTGRELGFPQMASLRSLHVIEGKISLSALAMSAMILRSGKAEYFEPESFSATEATYVTKRVGGRKEIKLTHTLDMAKQAWPKGKPDWEKSFQNSGWGRYPTDMLVSRAISRLARMCYSDVILGLYTPEEINESKEG